MLALCSAVVLMFYSSTDIIMAEGIKTFRLFFIKIYRIFDYTLKPFHALA
jgi:hypothetical protein